MFRKIVEKAKTPSLLKIPKNFSLWITVVIVLFLLLLTIAGQIGSSATPAPVTLQLSGQKDNVVPLGQENIPLNSISQP